MPLFKALLQLPAFFCVLLMSLAAQPSLAEIYKWTDANGKVHFSDKAPKGKVQKTETLDVEVTEQKIDPQMEDFRQRNRKLIQAWDGERAEDKKKQLEASKDNKKRADACASLRSRLAYSRKAASLYVPQADGGRSFYSDEQKAAYEAKMSKLMRKHCR